MKTICVYNQKGGVGKTTTVINLAAALGKKKKKILVLDMDPQGNATSGLGIDKKTLEGSIYDLLMDKDGMEQYIIETSAENVDIIPSEASLTGAEIELFEEENREFLLKKFLENAQLQYDYILIDCPPSLSFLSLNAIIASNSMIIPIQCEYYALEGVGQLMGTFNLIKQGPNPDIEIEGVVLSMFDGRNNLAIEVVEEVKKHFKNKVFKTVIPRNIRLAEAPSYGLSILDYDEKSKGAKAYQSLAQEFIKREKGRK